MSIVIHYPIRTEPPTTPVEFALVRSGNWLRLEATANGCVQTIFELRPDGFYLPTFSLPGDPLPQVSGPWSKLKEKK